MTFEIVAYTLLALTLAFGSGAVLFLFLAQRGPREKENRRTFVGDQEKQLALSVVLMAVLFAIGLAYVFREPTRMAHAEQRQIAHSVSKGTHTYVSVCVSCHGVRGEGGLGKALNQDQYRRGSAQEMDKVAEMLRKAISRGRYGTAMPAWALDDGGPLNEEQVNQLVALIQHGDWEEVARLAAAAPAQPEPAPGTTGAAGSETPHPGVSDLGLQGKQLYASKGCVPCHGTNLQGGVGPNLQHMASKQNIAGVAQMNLENLKKWLANPAALKRGTAMPNLGLDEREAEALAAFLMEQK